MLKRVPPADRRAVLEQASLIGDEDTRRAVVHAASTVLEAGDADAVLKQLAADGDPEVGPLAALVLGQELGARGETAAARAALVRALATGHPEIAPHAA